jgi:integrase
MSKPALHILSIEPLPSGSYRLFGQFLGKQIRKVSKNPAVLEKLREEMYAHIEQSRNGPVLRSTWLTEEQLHEAEAAVMMAKGRSLTELVGAGAAVVAPEFKRIEWTKAVEAWITYLKDRLRRFPETLTKNRNRMQAFYRQLPVALVNETTPEHIESWVLRSGVAVRTQLTDGAVIRSFFSYAVKHSWCGKTPFLVDLRELAGRAGRTERPRILTPEQCQALLSAADKNFDGELLPFVVLSTWGFMRKAEVCRTKIEDINFETGSIEIEPRKKGTPSYRVVTLPENALKILKNCAKRKLIPNGRTISYNRSRFDQLKESAGLVTSEKNTKRRARRKIVKSHWQENILRHTGISYFYQKTGNVREVCRQAGNSTETAFEHYLNLPKAGACKQFYAAGL